MPYQERPSLSLAVEAAVGGATVQHEAARRARHRLVHQVARQAGAGAGDLRARPAQQFERPRVAHLDAGLGEHPAGRVVHLAAGRVVPHPQFGARFAPGCGGQGHASRSRPAACMISATFASIAGSATKARVARSSATLALTLSSMVRRPPRVPAVVDRVVEEVVVPEVARVGAGVLASQKVAARADRGDLADGERLVGGGHVCHEGLGPTDGGVAEDDRLARALQARLEVAHVVDERAAPPRAGHG